MFSHPRGQLQNPNPGSKRRRRTWSLSSSLFSLGGSTGKRISLLFAMLNFVALLQYRNLMSRTLQATTKQHDSEWMVGSYHSIDNADIKRKPRKTRMTSQLLPKEANGRSSDAGFNTTAPEIVINATKITSQQRGQQNQRISASTYTSDRVDNSGKFAYVFLIGGAMSEKKGADYRGGLYGVVVAAHNLRRHGSKADVVVMVQISATTNATRLPELEEKLLEAMNIQVKYLPKYAHYKLESFYSLMMEKFRVLQLEEYSRVLYLDADILPLCNLDYMMKLSESGKFLRENVVLAYKGEPASGGFFVLKPNASDYVELVEIIKKTESKYLELEYPHWDPREGWGHIIDESDPWKSTRSINGTNWTFYGAQADQGLLYYWTKYYKKSVSIVNNNVVEQWGSKSATDRVRLQRRGLDILRAHVCTNDERERKGHKITPYINFIHFTGNNKPWYGNRTILEESIHRKINQTTFDTYNHNEYWFWLLQDALQKTGFEDKISLDFITSKKIRPSVGKTPSFDSRARYIRWKAQNGWRQYEYEENEVFQRPHVESTDLSVSGDNNRSRNDTDENVAMKAAPSSRSTKMDLQAKDLVTLLENFQPRVALKPFLPRLKRIENDINSSSGLEALAPSSSFQERDDKVIDTRKWAYAFLLGGARSDMIGTEYIAGLYSVVATAHQLRKLGSRADVVLMVQIAAESPHQKLSEFEEEILQKMNIKIVYIPKFANASMECFYSLMMEKFRILKLVDYSRVMYLDYDVMPTCNLDYLFDLSDPLPEPSGLKLNSSSFRLKENVILAYRQEPSSGGLFIVKPNLTDFDHIQRIIHEKETRSLELPYPHWDHVYGWGHVITPPDYWKDVRQRLATNWTWYGVQADQGLLYYWTKYVKKSVSIIIRDDVEQWDSDYWDTDTDGSLVLRRRQNREYGFPTIEKKALKSYGCPITGMLLAPYNDFVHLTGRAKPWYQTRKQLENPDCTNKHENECNIQAVWYSVLKDAMDSINVLDRFSWDFLGTMKGAPLGHAPTEEQIAMYMIAKKKRNWNQYRDDFDGLEVK